MKARPSIGRIVILKGLPGNGTDEHPAVITRVWSEGAGVGGSDLVNLTVLPDGGVPVSATSVYLFQSRSEATDQLGNMGRAAFWPERI